MRPLAIQLPQAAQAKLSDLMLARDAALDAARSASARLQQLCRPGQHRSGQQPQHRPPAARRQAAIGEQQRQEYEQRPDDQDPFPIA
jgi:hypothetical protein